MADIAILKKHLSEELVEYAKTFDIEDEFVESDSELIELVLKSKALDTEEEKQNWFNLLPLMTEEQVLKLREILLREKKKLEDIENKYDNKRKELRKKYLMKWQKLGYLEKVQKVKAEEESQEQKEDAEADALLDNL